MSLETVWAALGEDVADLARVRSRAAGVPLAAVLPVAQLVHDAIAAASLSAGLLASRGEGGVAPVVELDPARIATAVTSERHFRLHGEPMDAWAELSGFWPTSDGWVRTHANYPHHRERLLGALGLPAATDADRLRAALATRASADLERDVTAAGGIATEVRTHAQWRQHPQAAVVADQPLVSLARVGEAHPPTDPGARIRVLDLTRVIAGPVASRTLALWGADVLRVDPPGLPEIAWQHLDTGAGKRSTVLAADDPRFGELLSSAHVVITGYRPGSLERFGLSSQRLAERHPGLIVASLSAWGSSGPFAERRGFDSIVQAASGISWLESPDGSRPGALPAQALDHSAGYLLAAAITTALRRRAAQGGSWAIEVSLARIAQELLEAPREDVRRQAEFEPAVTEFGDVTVAASAARYEGGPLGWTTGPVRFGSSKVEWHSR